MPAFKKIKPGQTLTGIPAGDYNGAMDVARAFKEGRLGPRAKDGQPIVAPADLGTFAWNGYTVDIPEEYALQIFKALTNSGETDFLLDPLVESQNFDDDYIFDAGRILHRSTAPPSGGDDLVRLYSAGIVPATIYVHSALHRFVDAPYMGSQVKFWESDWDGPHQILWKESGTGEKKALLRLGENRPRLLWGRCKEAWRKRGGIPSQGNKWAYVNVELIDYSYGAAGVESDKVVRVLLPTNYDQDPVAWTNMVIGFKKSYQRSEGQTFNGFAMNAWPTYRYVAVTPNYFSSFIGDTKTVLTSGSWSCPGWSKVDGGQDDTKTLSGEAADASDRFLFFQKTADQTGGANTASFLSKDIIDNIAAHPDHTHPQNQTLAAGEAGENDGHIPALSTGDGGAAGHSAIDDTAEIEIDIRPSWQGAQLYERIDNSEGDEE